MSEPVSPPASERSLIRLEVQVEQLSKDLHRLNNLMMSANLPSDQKLSSQEKFFTSRLDTIEESQDEVKALVQKLSDKLENNSKFPWPTVLTFCGLMLGICGTLTGAAWTDVNRDITRVEREIKDFSTQVVMRPELDTRAKRFEELLRRVETLERDKRK